ncbi:subtilase-type protease inhibitor [Streptomyces netropsis]|uniref:subtilase-type protease inhibitor n=1 Tax=Streptomyces netropsis TaxID=55404 RepID=UPI0030CBFBA3
MLHRTRSLLLAILALLVLCTTSSQVWADSASLYPPSDLVLTFARVDDAGPDDQVDRAVTLTCMPRVAGTHPNASEACRLLHEADGSIANLPGRWHACTMEYMPVMVTAVGVWQGQRVTHEETFANRCILLRERGTVFDF